MKLLIPKSFLLSAFSEYPENDIIPNGEEDEDSEDMDEENTYENEGITLLIHFGVKTGGVLNRCLRREVRPGRANPDSA